MNISRELFEQQRRPRFGKANPEKMQLAFWEWMICGDELPAARRRLGSLGFTMREGKLKSTYGPTRAREFFDVPSNREDGPIWTFDRMGRTCNELPDGRTVCIGGEHEDFYDPDFYIYNDMVVFNAEGGTDIYGYPKEVFPPTDFHTATLTEGRIVIIGGLGYKNERLYDFTPVYALDLSDFHVDRMETTGEMPGWIHEHQAEVDAAGMITVRGGQIVRQKNGKQKFLRNSDDFSLNLTSGVWRRITDRKWQRYSISRDDEKIFPVQPYEKAKYLLPHSIECAIVECEWRSAKINLEGIEVEIEVGFSEIEVIIRGPLPEALTARLCEEVLMNTQSLFQCRCILERL